MLVMDHIPDTGEDEHGHRRHVQREDAERDDGRLAHAPAVGAADDNDGRD